MSRARLFAIASLPLVLALACTKKNPMYCARNSDCASGSCSPSLHACNATDGGGDTRDAGDAGDARDVGFKCTSSNQCADGGPDGAAAVCEMEAGTCVECLADKDCTATPRPICDVTLHMCGPCTADTQCAAKDSTGPGVCMFHQDGHCATDAETIYVKHSTGCSGGGDGTKGSPYCLSQDGVDAVTTLKRLVVLLGPDALSFWSASFSGNQVSIVGQGGATIAPGSFIGVHLSGGDAYIRGIKISGGSSVGLVADNSADLHLDGCVVEGNALGGIEVDNASFDITNTVIAKNKSTSTAGCGGWAGVCFNNIMGSPRFLNNTVVSNVGTGVACSSNTTAILGSIVFGNAPNVSACMETQCCSGDPTLSTDYHLTSGSTACIDQLAPAMSTAHDIDGQLRPRGSTGKSDCGADEL